MVGCGVMVKITRVKCLLNIIKVLILVWLMVKRLGLVLFNFAIVFFYIKIEENGGKYFRKYNRYKYILDFP